MCEQRGQSSGVPQGCILRPNLFTIVLQPETRTFNLRALLVQ